MSEMMDRHDAAEGEHGSDLLARISTEMVRAQKKYFGKGPESAKSYLLDDFLLIVMRGSQTVAEKTMVDFGKEDQVRAFRQTFENEMTSRLTGTIEDLTGRKVLGYQSQFLFEPEVVIEIFFFDETGADAAVTATALGRLEDPPAGEARSDAHADDVADEIAAD